MFSQTQHADACLGAAVKTSIDTLKVCLPGYFQSLPRCFIVSYGLTSCVCRVSVCSGGASSRSLAWQEAVAHKALQSVECSSVSRSSWLVSCHPFMS